MVKDITLNELLEFERKLREKATRLQLSKERIPLFKPKHGETSINRNMHALIDIERTIDKLEDTIYDLIHGEEEKISKEEKNYILYLLDRMRHHKEVLQEFMDDIYNKYYSRGKGTGGIFITKDINGEITYSKRHDGVFIDMIKILKEIKKQIKIHKS